jgi:hypothetical protein
MVRPAPLYCGVTTARSRLSVIPWQIPEKCVRVMSGEPVEATASPGQVKAMSLGAMKVTRAGVEPNGTTSEQAAAAPASGHVHLPDRVSRPANGAERTVPTVALPYGGLRRPEHADGGRVWGGERSMDTTSSDGLWTREHRSRRQGTGFRSCHQGPGELVKVDPEGANGGRG